MAKPIKTIAIAAIGNTGLEVQAIRSVLEYFGFKIIYLPIGRPNDFITVLNRSALYDDVEILIISAHGENGEIIMPELAKDIYEKNEPRKNFNATLIEKYGKLNGVGVVSTGCTLGREKMANAFLKTGADFFIATEDYIDGNASLLFLQFLFYNISKKENIYTAFKKAKEIDAETNLFQYFK